MSTEIKYPKYLGSYPIKDIPYILYFIKIFTKQNIQIKWDKKNKGQ